jgi:signal transduction histidine kinase
MQQISHQKKLIIILSLLVLLPLTLLGWQGWKINQDTKQLNDARFDSLVTARLNQVDTVVQSYFEEMQLKWSLLIPQWKLDKEATRQRIENNGIIRQIFVIDAQKIRRFPPMDNEITAAEKTFIDRLESVWRDPQVLFSNQITTASVEQVAIQTKQSVTSEAAADSEIQAEANTYASASAPAAISKFSRKQTAPANSSKQGWYMWHWGSDSNLIFWQQNNDGSIVGVEMEPIRVKADLISRLPDTAPGSASDFRLRLLDTAGHVVYQWGNFSITESIDTPQKRSPLSYPLSSWSLEYFGEPFSQTGGSHYSLLLSFLGFAFLIAALAWFLYREQTREMRLAAQRVHFVSQVSHELKTPLTNIRMYAEMLEQQIEDAEQPKRYLQVITDESNRLSRLISNVLNFSRAPRVHKREIIPDDVIKQSIEHFAPSFESRNIVLETRLNSAAKINTDPDILEQILNNLLSNVEKYAADGKRLGLSSEIKDKSFHLRVRDYGNGISRAERKHIFKPFYRINDKLTEGVSGTGIGLTIARQQAEYLGGTLVLIDVEPGACFELTLPIGETA